MLAQAEEKTEKPKKNKGGRPRGRKNNRTIYREAAFRAMVDTTTREGKKMPLDFLLEVMHDETNSLDKRLDAAKAAAGYVHPKLQSIEHAGEIAHKHEQVLDELE